MRTEDWCKRWVFIPALILVSLFAGCSAVNEWVSREDAQRSFWQTLTLADFQETKAFVERGVDVNDRGKEGETPLMTAVEFGDAEKVGILLRLGAQIDLKDDYGRTALMLAKRRNDTNITRLLKQAGAKE